MKLKQKKILSIILCIMSIVSAVTFMSVSVSAVSNSRIKFPSGVGNVSVYLGSERVLEGQSAIIDSVTYVGLRAFCDLIGDYDISWNDAKKTAKVSTDGLSLSATNGDLYLYANGRCIYTVEPIRIIDDRICVPIRALAKVLGVDVTWDGESRSVILLKGNKIFAWGSAVYDPDELYWLSRIISAEARGEPYVGMVAVGAVVLNRVKSSRFPNTIAGVIYQAGAFDAVADGQINLAPNEQSRRAARDALNGWDPTGGCLYYYNPATATSKWIWTREVRLNIGDHSFAV